MRFDAAVSLAACLLELFDLLLRGLQCVTDRLDEGLDRLLALGELVLRLLLLGAEVLLGEAQEVLAVRLQRLVGELVERARELRIGGLESDLALLLQRLLALDLLGTETEKPRER